MILFSQVKIMATVSPTSVMLVNINFSKKVVRLVLVVYLKKKKRED